MVVFRPVESLVQPQFLIPDTTPCYENHWIAVVDGRVSGGMHAFPMADMEKFPQDPLVPEERYAITAEYLQHIPAPDTYCIHVLAVYTEFRGKGIASNLLSLGLDKGREHGFTACSLYVFAENFGAVELYKKHGFKEAGRCSVPQHKHLYFPGDLLLMICAVSPATSIENCSREIQRHDFHSPVP